MEALEITNINFKSQVKLTDEAERALQLLIEFDKSSGGNTLDLGFVISEIFQRELRLSESQIKDVLFQFIHSRVVEVIEDSGWIDGAAPDLCDLIDETFGEIDSMPTGVLIVNYKIVKKIYPKFYRK